MASRSADLPMIEHEGPVGVTEVPQTVCHDDDPSFTGESRPGQLDPILGAGTHRVSVFNAHTI